MKINTHFDSSYYITKLEKELENIPGEVNLVLAENKGAGFMRADFEGLNFALTLNPENTPIIFCSFMPENYFDDEKFYNKFHALMAKKRVGFLQLPFTSEVFVLKYNELLQDEKEEDLLAIEINRVNSFESQMGSIKHGAQSFFRGEGSDYARSRLTKSISEARELGLTGNDDEIIQQIKDFEYQPKSSFFAGKFFPGIFCDIENTLLVNGEISASMFATLQAFSNVNRPITLWTGGEVKDLQKILTQNRISWKLISKTDLTGAEVEIAYDDENFDTFFKKYGVKVKKFIQI